MNPLCCALALHPAPPHSTASFLFKISGTWTKDNGQRSVTQKAKTKTGKKGFGSLYLLSPPETYFSFSAPKSHCYLLMLLYLEFVLIVILQLQTILQYFYKILIWSTLIGFHLGPPLISFFHLPIITNHISSL